MDIAQAQEEYASRLNGLARAREVMDEEQFALYEEDLRIAKDNLDIAWCERLMEHE